LSKLAKCVSAETNEPLNVILIQLMTQSANNYYFKTC